MTLINNTPEYTIQKLREVTDKLNSVKVDLKMRRYIFPFFNAYPEDDYFYYKEDLSRVLENFALCFRNKCPWLITQTQERFICSLIDEDVVECMFNPELYNSYFKVVKPNTLTIKLFYNRTLYVFDDDCMLVITNKNTDLKFREIRGNK